jgi:hypothetical protein
MGDFWSSKMLSVREARQPYNYKAAEADKVTWLASILQKDPAVVSGISAELRSQGLFAGSQARQIAQIAIASKCGNGVRDGISFMKALSLPVLPVKRYGPKNFFGASTGGLFAGYTGFKTRLSLLERLPEEHSFVDLFELLIIGAARRNGEKPILEREEIELGAAVMFDRTAQVTFEQARLSRELVIYIVPEEFAGMQGKIAQFSGRAIALLATLIEKIEAVPAGAVIQEQAGSPDGKPAKMAAPGSEKEQARCE